MRNIVIVCFFCLLFAAGATASEKLTPEQVLKNRIVQAQANILSYL